MQEKRVFSLLTGILVLSCSALLLGENGIFTGSGGAFTAGTAAGKSISVQGVPLAGTSATLSLTCTIATFGAGTYQWNWTCSGGSVAVISADHSVSIAGAFVNGTMALTCSGGGRGGRRSCLYQFNGTFDGQAKLAGAGQGALGAVAVGVKVLNPIGSASAPVTGLSLGWNSQYSPVLVAEGANSRLLLADNITGVNLASYGAWGSGTGQFESIAGLAHDSAGRIYVTDRTLDRVVRIDNMKGANWLQLGGFGVGNLHFSGPQGVAIDSAGRIYVADAGNNRIVRFTDMTGANWTSFGTFGSGANQFSSPAAIAFDAQGRIYVADYGNGRLARFDDLTGKNWTTLSTISIGPYAYNLSAANGVAVLPSGKIVVSTWNGWTFRVDDMTGANPEVAYWSASLAGLSSDPAGALYIAGGFTPGLAQILDAIGTGFFGGTMGQGTLQASAVLSMARSAAPPAAPVISKTGMAFGKQNVGEPSAGQAVVLSNIGGAPLPISSIAADADFKLGNPCGASLAGGVSCAVSVVFEPASTGAKSTAVSFETTSVHPLLETALSGIGTAPQGVLLPASLAFDPQKTATSSSTQAAILTNTGTGPLTISSIAAAGDFSVTHNCPAVVLAGNGCTLQVMFTPTAAGARIGGISIKDDNVPAGTTQTIALAGTGSATAPLLTLTPESLLFPAQQVGVASAAQTLTLKNGSSSAVSLSAPVIPAGFTAATTCGKSLAAAASCVINVRFAPAAAGLRSAAVSVPVTGQPTLTAGVAGTGVSGASPVLVVTPSPLNFGLLTLGDDAAMNLTVSNPKGYPVGIRSTAFSGPPQITLTASNCPLILAGGASCTVQFTFVPQAVASYSATWTLTESSGAATPVSIVGAAGNGGN